MTSLVYFNAYRALSLPIVMIALLGCLSLGGCGEKPSLPEGVARIDRVSPETRAAQAFIKAFNDHDPAAMAALCDENLQWGYVSGTEYSIAGRGLDTLQSEMKKYFASTPNVQSSIEDLIAHDNTVAMTERVRWGPEGAVKTQASIAVYQFTDGRISTVWYYPAS